MNDKPDEDLYHRRAQHFNIPLRDAFTHAAGNTFMALFRVREGGGGE